MRLGSSNGCHIATALSELIAESKETKVQVLMLCLSRETLSIVINSGTIEGSWHYNSHNYAPHSAYNHLVNAPSSSCHWMIFYMCLMVTKETRAKTNSPNVRILIRFEIRSKVFCNSKYRNPTTKS